MIKNDIGQYIEKNAVGYSISKHLQDVYLFKKDDGRPAIVDQNSKGQIKTQCASYHKIQRLTGTFVRDGDTGIRLFTENECKAIMGFPESFIIPVAIPVIEAIAKEIQRSLNTYNRSSETMEMAF